MKYNEIKKIIQNNNISLIDLDISTSVLACVGNDKRITDEIFDLLCSYTRKVWGSVDKGYTQLVADIVVDCYIDNSYGYHTYCKLTKKDLKEHNKLDKIIDIFCSNY